MLRIDALGPLLDGHFMYPLFFQIKVFVTRTILPATVSRNWTYFIFRGRREAMRPFVSSCSVALRERRPQGCAVGELRKGPQQLGEGAQRVKTTGVTTINASLAGDALAVRLGNSTSTLAAN